MRDCVTPFSVNQTESNYLPASLDEHQLVEGLRRGEHDAFAELMRRYERRLNRTAMRILRNKEDSEDAVQEAFLKVYWRIESFEGRSGFYTWMTSVLVNGCLVQLRKQRCRPQVSLDEPWGEQRSWHDSRVDIEGDYSILERSMVLSAAMAKLNPKLRAILDTYRSGDFTMAEVADLHGISITAAKSRLLRARNTLKESLIVRTARSNSSARVPALQRSPALRT